MEEKQKTGTVVITKILGHRHGEEPLSKEADFISMTHDQLLKPHQKAVTEAGLCLGISLEGDEKLFDGAILWEDQKTVVVVRLVEEDVLEIRPAGNESWAKAAFNIGNMHHPAYIYPDFIRVPYDPVIYRMLQHLDVAVTRKMAPLDGERANVSASHGHHHDSHSHSHDSHSHPHSHEE